MNTPTVDSINLARGGHNDRSNGLCFNEAVAWLAGEEHSAAPACVSPAISAFTMRLNDRFDNDRRQLLKPYLLKVIGTKTNPEDELRRGYLAADWLIRTATPL